MPPATPPDHRFRDHYFWTDNDDLPDWHGHPARSNHGHGAIHLLLAVVVAAALALVVFDAAASAAYSYSPCFFRASTQHMSVGPIQHFRQRVIPGQPAPPSCPIQPADPFHLPFALTGEARGAR